jgi:hypothetical protein
MSKRFRDCNLDQMLLLAPSLYGWLPEGHLARFVDGFRTNAGIGEQKKKVYRTSNFRSRSRVADFKPGQNRGERKHHVTSLRAIQTQSSPSAEPSGSKQFTACPDASPEIRNRHSAN